MSGLHQIFMHVTHVRGSVLLWRRSRFMDYVIFAHNVPAYGRALRLTPGGSTGGGV